MTGYETWVTMFTKDVVPKDWRRVMKVSLHKDKCDKENCRNYMENSLSNVVEHMLVFW